MTMEYSNNRIIIAESLNHSINLETRLGEIGDHSETDVSGCLQGNDAM